MTSPICPECFRLGSGHGSLESCDVAECPAVPTDNGECPLCGYQGCPVTQDEIAALPDLVTPAELLGFREDPAGAIDYEGLAETFYGW